MNTYKIPNYELYEIEPLETRPWGFDKINIDSIWAKSQGEGLVGAIIDSGLDVKHPEFEGRIIGARNFTHVGSSTDIKGKLGQGIHAARAQTAQTAGMAPKNRGI